MQIKQSLAVFAALAVLASPAWAASDSSAKPILEGLIGKHQVIGFTVHDGSRFLGRVLSGDHGLYIVQTFHYVTAPVTVPVTTTQTSYVVGRRGQVRPVTKRVTERETTQKTVADDAAVKALVSGVAGASFHPQEQPAGREMIAPTDLRCLQQLSPPPSGKANWTLQTLWSAPAKPATK
jgi:hypothetical protein